jgi:hypothetical protein
MPPVPMGLHDGAAVFGHKLPGGGALVNVPDYLLLVKNKVVGIDVSTLLHGLCQSMDIQQMQAIDPRNSVAYPVANLLSTYFKAKALDEAKAIVAVFDPKRLNCHHCGECKETYEAAYATKCDITGRNSRGVAAVAAEEAYNEALATYYEATDGADDTHSARNTEGDKDPLKEAFDTWVKAADTCTSSVEEAARHFFVEWNVKVNEARALAAKGGGGGVPLTAKSQTENWASRPLIHCVASPVEADDQLAYFVRCGLIDLVISVDTDFVCMRGLPLLATKSAVSRVKYGSSLRQYSKNSVIARARVLFGIDDDDECDLDTACHLFTAMSCATGNDYVLKSCSVAAATPVICAHLAERRRTGAWPGSWTLADKLYRLNHADKVKRKSKLKYPTKTAFVAAFREAFEVYNCGRQWVRALHTPRRHSDMDDVCARLSVSVRVCVRGRETCVRAHDDVLCVVVPLLPRNLKELYRPSLSSRRTRFASNNPPAETNPSIWRRSSSFRRLRESMFGSAAISTSSGSLRRHVSRVAWACARVCMYVYACV